MSYTTNSLRLRENSYIGSTGHIVPTLMAGKIKEAHSKLEWVLYHFYLFGHYLKMIYHFYRTLSLIVNILTKPSLVNSFLLWLPLQFYEAVVN